MAGSRGLSGVRALRRGLVASLLGGLTVGVAVGHSSVADDPPSAPSRARILFDGKGLDGWKKTESFKSGGVRVEEGSIILEAGGPMSGVTCTLTDLPTTDYELNYEARRLAGEDFFAAATFPVGTSYITLVNGGWGGSVTGLSCINGSDASENETRRFVKYENGRWYKFRVRVTAEVIRCWVDEREVVAFAHRDVRVKTRLETRASQPLGFASYRSKAAVRGVELRRLTPGEVAAHDKIVEG